MRFYGWMRLGLLVEDIHVHGLRVGQKKNGSQLVLSKDIKERKDGCFGAVFKDIPGTRHILGEGLGDDRPRILLCTYCANYSWLY